ncbi:MAG: hypothetical protein U1E43_01285 [Rhodospirillales bacterium]
MPRLSELNAVQRRRHHRLRPRDIVAVEAARLAAEQQLGRPPPPPARSPSAAARGVSTRLVM